VSQHDVRTGVCIGEFRPPPSIPLLLPTDVAIDEHGLCYVSDGDGNSIHVYERNGDFLCRSTQRISARFSSTHGR